MSMSEKRHVWEKLKVTEIAVVDELASTAELVMGKSRGYLLLLSEV